jgi:1,4-alpha-glucan branching enzyme
MTGRKKRTAGRKAPPPGETLDPGGTFLGEQDLHLFNEGRHVRLYEKLGAHAASLDGAHGTRFAVWAPSAERVSVVGDFNEWNESRHRLHARGSSGIWEGFVPGLAAGTVYKYAVKPRSGELLEKADPFAFAAELPPKTASVVWGLDHEWGDAEWMTRRTEVNALEAPISVYELHLGSWRHATDDPHRSLSYVELADALPAYVEARGFTHVELVPVMEHPFYGSWGYQTTGFFAPTSRYGTPQELMALVDALHRCGIGVILDWVPSHFPDDPHGLAAFDGSHLYEHADPREGRHPDWGSLIFNYGRHEVRSFLLSSALFWLDRYHVDGLRVDAVASMLYRDYSREQGEWVPNVHGGRENLEAIDFLRQLNEEVYGNYPDVQTYAEESTAWPMVSRPTYLGGLGFGLKWDMGWMHDTLQYMARDPLYRAHHHNELTFRAIYASNENFVLPLSHDEVVHGKGSLLGKMPGDEWQQLANLRLLYGYQWAQPGKKLLFMGGEIAQRSEWNHDTELEWGLLEHQGHAGIQRWIDDLNRLYRDTPALHELDCDAAGFEWVDANDAVSSVIAFLRRGHADEPVLVVCNFTPVPRANHRVGVPSGGVWRELLNSDADVYGGSGQGNLSAIEAAPVPFHGRPHSLVLTLPPLAALFLSPELPGRA